MKLLNKEGALVTQLFRAEEITPEGGVFIPELLAALSERYNFITLPDPADAIRGAGLKFSHGQLSKEQKINIISLQIFNDGIVVECRDTEACDIVLDDAIAYIKEKFKFREPAHIAPRKYVSVVVVNFDNDISNLLKGFSKIKRLLESSLVESNAISADIHVGRLTLLADPALHPEHTNTEFVLEQRVNRPFSENSFFSKAALSSQLHLKLLQQIDDIAVDTN